MVADWLAAVGPRCDDCATSGAEMQATTNASERNCFILKVTPEKIRFIAASRLAPAAGERRAASLPQSIVRGARGCMPRCLARIPAPSRDYCLAGAGWFDGAGWLAGAGWLEGADFSGLGCVFLSMFSPGASPGSCFCGVCPL